MTRHAAPALSDTAADYLTVARELRKMLDASAIKGGAAPVSSESVRAMSDAGLFGVMSPREVGGAELPLVDVIDIFEEVARADASTGWCLMAGASAAAYFGSYGGDEFVAKAFADGVPLVAGQFAPNGTGTPEGEGYRISGSDSVGSGLDYANWVGAGFLVLPPEGSDAAAEYRFAVVPKAEVELRGNWDVLGLQSTASLDYGLDGAVSPGGANFLFATPARHRGGPVFELGVMALTAAGHAGFALGVTRRALDELMAIATTKVRMGAGSFMKDSERFLLTLGQLESRYRASRAWVAEAFGEAEANVTRTEQPNPADSLVVRQATVHATTEAVAIVHEAYLTAGTSSLRDGPLQRCFRDIHAASQHFFASPASTLDFGRDLMAKCSADPLDA
jgi:alkylation response protein AidB-like acyl-CoA dehydrogenase